MAFVTPTELRTRFACAMSDMYRKEVPLYGNLIDLVRDVNEPLQTKLSIEEQARLTQERHGAIRVGKPEELRNLARMFRLLGMYAVGYYDLSTAGLPVHATAFRPVETNALLENPFRVFTSLLRLDLIADQATRELAEKTLASREIFSARSLELIAEAERDGGVKEAAADEFVASVLQTFAFNVKSTVTASQYEQLRRVSPLVADICSFATPHINHLTPCTLDIDAVQLGMIARGIPPKSIIEGPPARLCPIMLRQTSFTALEERIVFDTGCESTSKGDIGSAQRTGAHKARFGEIESRGAALTTKGRALFDELFRRARETEVAIVTAPHGDHAANEVHQAHLERFFSAFPDDWETLRAEGLVFGRYVLTGEAAPSKDLTTLDELVRSNQIVFKPVLYEDFLPASAAGIFSSNIGTTTTPKAQIVAMPDQDAFERSLGHSVLHADTIYRQIQDTSIRDVAQAFPGLRL